MRDNTIALNGLPQFSVIDGANNNGKWARLQFPSVRAAHEASKTFARTDNEKGCSWFRTPWNGLETISMEQFDQSGISPDAVKLVQAENTALAKVYNRLDKTSPAIVGGVWNVPAVLAGVPMAARSRKRAKLAPKDIRIAYFLSGGIDARSMAKITARMSRAIWDYQMAGGTVSLTVAHVGAMGKRSGVSGKQYEGASIECKVNCADIAAVALVLSPTMLRAVAAPLLCALSNSRSDSIPPPSGCPLPGFLWCGGRLSEALENADKVVKMLEIQ